MTEEGNELRDNAEAIRRATEIYADEELRGDSDEELEEEQRLLEQELEWEKYEDSIEYLEMGTYPYRSDE